METIRFEGTDTDATSTPALRAYIELNSDEDYRGRGVLMTTRDGSPAWYMGVPYAGHGFTIGRASGNDPKMAAYYEPPNTNSLVFITEGGLISPGHIKATTSTHNGAFDSTNPSNGYYEMNRWIQTHGCAGYHVCDAIEVTRYLQRGESIVDNIDSSTSTVHYWVNSGLDMWWSSAYHSDCWGWTSYGSDQMGSTYRLNTQWGNIPRPGSANCDQKWKVLCCK